VSKNRGELKMKFKVGQKVKVKDFYDIAGTFDTRYHTRGLHFSPNMVDLCNKECTIENIRGGYSTNEDVAELSGTDYVFIEEWLEPIYNTYHVTLKDIYKADKEYASFLAQQLCVIADLIVVELSEDIELIPEHYYKTVSMNDVEFTITNDHSDVDEYHTHAVIFEDDDYDFISDDLVAKICNKK
jgi:hypothetical protein